MSKSGADDKQVELVRALEEARDYLEFSAEKYNFANSQYYLAVQNYLEHVLKELNS